MKILFISSPSFVDCDLPLIKEYQNKNIDITYLLLVNPYELRSTLIDIKNIYPKTGIFSAKIYDELNYFSKYLSMDKFLICNRHGKSKKTVSYWKEKLILYKFIKKGKYNIIHTNLLFSNEFKFIYNLSNVITTIHDPFPHSGEDWNYKKSQYFNAINNSKGLVLLNSEQKNLFCEKYNVSDKIILNNKLGVYDVINIFKQDKPHKENNAPNVLFFGRIAPYKGIEYLCEAMKLVHEEIPEATLTIAGKGNLYFDYNPYKNLDYFEFRNYFIGANELADLLNRASITVCPYVDATQSGVIMTSMAMGKPVIATNVGGLGEIIEDGFNGLLVPPKNPKELAKAIIKLLKNKESLKTFQDNIATTAQTSLSWNSIADKYLYFYNNICFGINANFRGK